MNYQQSLIAGVAGAVALNVVHESVRQFVPTAPRVDLIGKQLTAQAFRQLGKKPPQGDRRYALAMVADVLSNSLYYSLVGRGSPRSAELRGLLLGVAGGVGAVIAPNFLDVSKKAVQRDPSTVGMTIAYYMLGGVIAGGVGKRLSKLE